MIGARYMICNYRAATLKTNNHNNIDSLSKLCAQVLGNLYRVTKV